VHVEVTKVRAALRGVIAAGFAFLGPREGRRCGGLIGELNHLNRNYLALSRNNLTLNRNNLSRVGDVDSICAGYRGLCCSLRGGASQKYYRQQAHVANSHRQLPYRVFM